MSSAQDAPSSGMLPGRYEWVEEPERGEVPTDPEWNRFSDVMRSFEADAGASIGRQDGLGTPDAVDHNRGMEEPSASVGYDMQQFFVDTDGNPKDASGYGLIRDEFNRLPGTLLAVGRREYPGGNDGAGIREYRVVHGAAVDSVSPTLDPSGENPILLELEFQPTKVRSYLIHQLSEATTFDIVSTEDNDTMDITIENEDASTTETIALDGTTSVTTTESFSSPDAIWLSEAPEGNIEITDGNGTVVCQLEGGLEYSDDDQPVDGDQGVPVLGSGSRASEIGTKMEHFVGDRFERPVGEPIRPRVNSGGWSVENNTETNALHDTRAPTVDEGNRNVSVDADVGGPYISHRSMLESLQKVQHDLEHELSGGIVRFKNTVPTDSATETSEADQAVVSGSETFEASGDPAIELEANA